ncbi:hypothetical protein [endosymbiont GvMRE of Glomus versiforme]|uniref:hypothetical protein n=1 Tax=endosymbiont GvMRE of Glomus versiforme TaxID=2039283 RepID=UPI000EEA104F|nr:hypothetical protein [endosymbiont GvMRE of Glomus versiforme]RHZ37765.1 hypothetical protein GvMRE_I1g30 [endosymbiont GvMRE of Glomus versiforme]
MKDITYQQLKEFVNNLDTSNLKLNPQEISLNEVACISNLLTLHSESLINRARVIKGKGDLGRELEKIKAFNSGDFDKEVQAGEHYAIEHIVIPHTHKQASFGVQGFWQETVLNFLKEKSLEFIIGCLRGLVKNAIPAMVDFANTIINQLEKRIIDLYKKANEDERRLFKENIARVFPQSKLLEKLNEL